MHISGVDIYMHVNDVTWTSTDIHFVYVVLCPPLFTIETFSTSPTRQIMAIINEKSPVEEAENVSDEKDSAVFDQSSEDQPHEQELYLDKHGLPLIPQPSAYKDDPLVSKSTSSLQHRS